MTSSKHQRNALLSRGAFSGFEDRATSCLLAHTHAEMSGSAYIGVDVGTGSVRAALVTRDGHVTHTSEESLHVWEPCADHYEQSSADIWSKCCTAVKKVTRGIDVDSVRGIGFDATCSLVALDRDFQPVAVNQTGIRERNVVMWMDHRAAEQASRITATKHEVLQRVGGVMSPEMQPPKLLWLKENLRETCWKETAHFFDLPDFLSWKATGSLARSLCTVVCKWTYSPSDGWNDTFWTAAGLEDLVENNYSRIGAETGRPGSLIGRLTAESAADLGLKPGTAVGASLIDAHAGGLGVMGSDVSGHHLPCENQPITSRMAVICGTSSCHMAVSERALFVPGVWGPYLSAMVPDLWLNEGGQSATGRLVEHVVKGHVAYTQLKALADKSGKNVYSCLNVRLENMTRGPTHLEQLTAGLHVWPDFHGNRSPLADQTSRGTVVGLTLSQTLDDLALLYLATLQAIALGTRHIIDAMREAGHDITTLFLCGGLSKNTLLVQLHANVTGLPVVLSEEREPVLVGAAVLGACASSDYSSIQEILSGAFLGSNEEHEQNRACCQT
ncbi:FGGY carbohydrate kinase domain-containing protein isoform X3 [Triplophysa rosa]|uniref:FGGY carbohydrate kinase domain-containing protein isoform X3 n=1 Tax=Triplophysa rosa TaxID=992332 RepID=UPI00254613AA|nr:FGGY carbohydrate kinase domain-containing protein isoform X3 [Triplophysa rosa]